MSPLDDAMRKWLHPLRALIDRRPPIAEPADQGPNETVGTAASDLPPRFKPCRILAGYQIPCVVWFEDVLVFYGSDTALFDLNLLVPDARQAADSLMASGCYREAAPKVLFPNDVPACRGGIRLETSQDEPSCAVVLIDAARWSYDLASTEASCTIPIPPLNGFLNSLMGYWLNLSEEEYVEKLLWSMSLASLIYYCYNLEGPNFDLVRSPDFADHLQPEHRELHYDLVGEYPLKSGISTFRKHKYHALRSQQIKAGTFTPRPYPTANVPVSLAEYPDLNGLDLQPIKSTKKTKKKQQPDRRSQKSLQSIAETTP